jgi:hypothetical protein
LGHFVIVVGQEGLWLRATALMLYMR